METQFERAMAIKDRQLKEQCATIQGLTLALEEAQRQIAELTKPQSGEQGKKNRG